MSDMEWESTELPLGPCWYFSSWNRMGLFMLFGMAEKNKTSALRWDLFLEIYCTLHAWLQSLHDPHEEKKQKGLILCLKRVKQLELSIH